METERKHPSNFINRTGQRYGRLTALEYLGGQKWRCKCDCGNELVVRVSHLCNGHTQSCGCLQKERVSESTLIDITGQRFGRLTVLSYAGDGRWNCRCDCGRETVVRGNCLHRGTTQSCGCLARELARERTLIDLTGQRFGRLTALEYVGESRWKCQCDCGNITYVLADGLRGGHTQSCGCLQRERTVERCLIDLTGQHFGQLTALEYMGDSKWKCRCDCGNEVIKCSSDLRDGTAQSCGCLRTQYDEETRYTRNRLANIFSGMKSRCYNPNNKRFRHYGARGIEVCDEWMQDPEAFKQWALANGYDNSLTIDRINNDGPYSPENCRWATFQTQANNTSQNVRLSNGQTVTEYCREHGLSNRLVLYRLRRGWSEVEALTIPKQGHPVKELCDKYGFNCAEFRNLMYQHHLSFAEAIGEYIDRHNLYDHVDRINAEEDRNK